MYNNNIVQQDLKLITQQDIEFTSLKNKSILITGATGMLASYYMYVLLYLNTHYDYNIKVYALVRNKKKLQKLITEELQNTIEIIEQSVTKPFKIKEKVDYIIHMASSANPKTITTDPVGIIEANVLGTLYALEIAKRDNARIIFTSTREVYGKMAEDVSCITEDDMGVLDCLDLRSCYPESKKQAENLIISYAYQYGIEYAITRIAHSYGPGMIIHDDGRIMSDLLCNVVEGNNIVLKSRGEAKRAFCYIVDAITALFKVTLDINRNLVYNVANETEEISIKDLAYFLQDKYTHKGIKVMFDIQENKSQYVKFDRVRLSTHKLENIGWEPIVSLSEGIDKTVKFFESIKR